MVEASILIPTFDHGPTLRHSVASALDQTVREIEVLVIGDGVSDATREIVAELRSGDGRVRFFDNPKGPRNGEIHRHSALQDARGKIICYLSDDDLYTPDHVETMLQLLSHADFAHSPPLLLNADRTFRFGPIDLSDPEWRAKEVGEKSLINLTNGAHTLDMYRRLPHGWRTTPVGIYTDHYMWKQFLEISDCRALSGPLPTALGFPSSEFFDLSNDERASLMEHWRARTSDLAWRDRLVLEILMEGAYEAPRLRRRLKKASQRPWNRTRRGLQHLMGRRRRSRIR